MQQVHDGSSFDTFEGGGPRTVIPLASSVGRSCSLTSKPSLLVEAETEGTVTSVKSASFAT
jgi:hypothetical protein